MQDPREAGTSWFSAYWQETYTVLKRDGIWLTVRWHGDGRFSNSVHVERETTHCTAYDPKDKQVNS